jgi:hypothetical protein
MQVVAVDDVRVLGNVSKGTLGAQLADRFLATHRWRVVSPSYPRSEGCHGLMGVRASCLSGAASLERVEIARAQVVAPPRPHALHHLPAVSARGLATWGIEERAIALIGGSKLPLGLAGPPLMFTTAWAFPSSVGPFVRAGTARCWRRRSGRTAPTAS